MQLPDDIREEIITEVYVHIELNLDSTFREILSLTKDIENEFSQTISNKDHMDTKPKYTDESISFYQKLSWSANFVAKSHVSGLNRIIEKHKNAIIKVTYSSFRRSHYYTDVKEIKSECMEWENPLYKYLPLDKVM